LDLEDKENFIELSRHTGMRILFEHMESIIQKMKNDILSVAIPSDPVEAGLVLYASRKKLEGAMSFKYALGSIINKTREGRE